MVKKIDSETKKNTMIEVLTPISDELEQWFSFGSLLVVEMTPEEMDSEMIYSFFKESLSGKIDLRVDISYINSVNKGPLHTLTFDVAILNPCLHPFTELFAEALLADDLQVIVGQDPIEVTWLFGEIALLTDLCGDFSYSVNDQDIGDIRYDLIQPGAPEKGLRLWAEEKDTFVYTDVLEFNI